MADWSVGDWVFACSSEDNYWYPAEIIAVKGKQFNVKYDFDETQEWLADDSLTEYSAQADETGAEAWSDDDEAFYAVTILKVKEAEVQVEYEDGTQEWTDLSYLRFAGE
jgi:hypothetical protein